MKINAVDRHLLQTNYVTNIIISFVLLLVVAPCALGASPETLNYTVVDGDTLKMDIYRPAGEASSMAPAVIFTFGGGFMGGARDCNDYMQYFNFLNSNGIAVISIDYRTTLLKHYDKSIPGLEARFAKALVYAVSDAVLDLYCATAYVLENAMELGIDTKKIFASGSSAGAITALQAEYLLANGLNEGVALPSHFNYAGIVSFAGAIYCEGNLAWNTRPCPMMLFHGDADKNVPYSILSTEGMNLYGSEYISKTLATCGAPCEFYSFKGRDHAISLAPMHDNLYTIVGFILRVCEGKEIASVNASEFIPGTTQNYKTKFSIEEYIRANMQ